MLRRWSATMDSVYVAASSVKDVSAPTDHEAASVKEPCGNKSTVLVLWTLRAPEVETQGETVRKSNINIMARALLAGRMDNSRAWHFLKQRVPCTTRVGVR